MAEYIKSPTQIKLKLILIISFIMLFLLLLNYIRIVNVERPDTIEDAENKIANETEQLNQEFEAFINFATQTILEISKSDTIQSYFGDTAGNFDVLSNLFLNYGAVLENLFQIRLINATGFEEIKIEIKYDLEEKIVYQIQNNELQNKSEFNYFNETRKFDLSEVFISHINLNREFGEISYDNSQNEFAVIRFATPLNYSGNFRGILVLNYYVLPFYLELQEQAAKYFENPQTAILDQDGYFLFNSEELKWTSPENFDTKENIFNLISDLKNSTFHQEQWNIYQNGYYIYAKNLEINFSDQNFNLKIIITVNDDEILQEIDDQIIGSLIFFTLIAVIMIIVSYFPINYLQQDITRATDKIIDTSVALYQSNQELERFAYIASHDLQEPARVVRNFVKLLEDRYNDSFDDEGRDFIKFISEGSQRMLDLIEDLLVYSRVSTKKIKFELIDLGDEITKVLADLKLLIEEQNTKVVVSDMSKIYGDPIQLRQLFQNLITNAIKYKKDNIPPIIEINSEIKDDNIVISVRDNGIGIEEKYFEKIFEIFQRLHQRDKFEGTGIGLTICRRIMEQHKGKIWLESQPDVGTTFYLQFSIF